MKLSRPWRKNSHTTTPTVAPVSSEDHVPVKYPIGESEAETAYRFTHGGRPMPPLPKLTDADLEALLAARRNYFGWR